jgi:hypothetical protein
LLFRSRKLQWTYASLESFPLLKSERVGLGNDGNDVDDLGELLHHDHVDLQPNNPSRKTQRKRNGRTRHGLEERADERGGRVTNWLEAVTCRVDEKEAAVDSGVLDVLLTHRCQLLSEVGGVLVLDLMCETANTHVRGSVGSANST